MKRKQEALNAPEQIPLLEGFAWEKIQFEERREHFRKRWYRLYFLTVAVAFFVVACVLFVSLCEPCRAFLGSLGREPSAEAPTTDTDEESRWQDVFLPEDTTPAPPPSDGSNSSRPPLTKENLYTFDYSAVPSGQLPILPMDLSLLSLGAGYVQNMTGLSPDTEALLQGSLRQEPILKPIARTEEPVVLILHTHGTESYSPDGAISYVEGREDVRSENVEENVVAVGRVLAETLEARGISTLHCTILHDRVQYKDSYARAEQTIRAYLAEYPSIRLVIDLHRDAVMKSTGEMVRPITLNSQGEATAQVMCVVGSSWNGEENEQWQGNLALALKLREKLNQTTEKLCRPPYLRGATYNQEFAPYSLLLEIGAGGNSLAEAKRAAVLVGEALVGLISEM